MTLQTREKPSATIEDYLQVIYNLTDEGEASVSSLLARRMKVTPPTAWAAVRRMERDGLVTLDAKKVVRLTPQGRELAESTVRRHRLAERFLTDVLGLGWGEAHAEAHRFEHAISPRLEERIFALLRHPTTCPHGSPIPGTGAVLATNLLPLDRLMPGESATIELIAEELEADGNLLHYLERGHIMPGQALRMLEKTGGIIIVEVDGGQVPLALEVASKIRVRPSRPQ